MAETENNQPTISDRLMNRMVQAINTADINAAKEQVRLTKKRHPNATQEEIAEKLIKRKCWQAGNVGAITSGAALIPGLGTFTSLTFGIAADIGVTFKLQAELVLEMAELYQYELTEGEKRAIIMTVTGISAGSNQLFIKTGQQIAKKATAELAERSIVKAIPFIGIAASGGTNIVSTYYIGKRAQAYFGLGPEAMDDWAESARALSGIDERKLVNWLTETTVNSWQSIQYGVNRTKDGVVVAGKTTGKVIVLGTSKVTSSVVDAGKWVGNGITAVSGSVANLFKRNKTAEQIGQHDNAANLISEAPIQDEQLIGVVGIEDDLANHSQSTIHKLLSAVMWWQTSNGEDSQLNEEVPLIHVDDDEVQKRFGWLPRFRRKQKTAAASPQNHEKKNGRFTKLWKRFRRKQ